MISTPLRRCATPLRDISHRWVSKMKKVTINAKEITDWESFHDVFQNNLDFPNYYGRNLNAWIDCMGDEAISGDLLHLRIEGMKELKERCPEIYEAIGECSAFVNYRLTENGEDPVLALSYDA